MLAVNGSASFCGTSGYACESLDVGTVALVGSPPAVAVHGVLDEVAVVGAFRVGLASPALRWVNVGRSWQPSVVNRGPSTRP